ncbi:MAG: response regulator transcription factor [Candidatus Thiodiazotropha sp. (ex Lucina aurantia)]|nr:response regulator transcription factor [Candidatus Thiodiazotropha taylori]MBV2101003.1 response regulator transcription factor [Candidatus Thiodiazotropha sp. (ex Codakia orbicularis)]MBV2105196.1 response regulator transcription factor [Candidatus Thiodiazotropha sp. (ex Lucina aurantia)]MBV2119650.1 response regulator transcription factor [Candidatus Thiodiazotropha sp. (ex Lucina aurantia)]
MNQKPRILIVEDEEAIRVGLIDVFVFHGFTVDSAAEGPAGLQKALTSTFDMILLDVMLPGMNGFDICNRIREQDKDQPIIMLTAKTSDEDIVQGLTLGADDYVAKPFSVAQLVLRVQAVLRRSRYSDANLDYIRLGDAVEIDIRNLSGKRSDEPLSFTKREMEIIEYLHSHRERPVSREELLNKVWGYAKNADIETRTVDIHIAKLRRKIEINSAEPRFLTTVRGAGYRLLLD